MREARSPRRTRRTRRALALAFIAACALLVAGLFVATRSFALRAIVEPRLADALGAEVSIGHASLSGFTTVTLRDVVGVAPGVPTDASTVLVVERLDATLDWGAILAGRFGVREVRFDKPTLRLSQRVGTSTLNIANLNPSPGGSAPLELPLVVVRGGRVEFGEHDDAAYSRLATIEVDGSLSRSDKDRGIYQIALVESASSAESRAPKNPTPITLEGLYDPIRVEGRLMLENLDLASWGPQAAPSDVRDLWTRLRLEGEVERTEFVYSDRDGVRAEFHFADVALLLPIAADPQADLEFSPGPRAEPDRFMRISDAKGTATLGASGLHAQITGLIEDLPYRVVFDTTSLGLDAGFTIRFDTAEPFQVAQRPQLLPFAPPVVRRRIESFSSPTALMEARVVVTRGESRQDSPAPVSIAGVLDFREGSASFADFPYPVRDMTARVRFDEDRIVIEEMTGKGPTGASMRVQGVIAPPTDGAMVDLQIVFDDLPLDDAFDAAMPSSRAGLLGSIFSREAESRLRDAGLLPDSFALGGVGTLDIRVFRAQGENSEYLWRARLSLPEAGLLVDRFPLPAIVEHATIEVTSEVAEVRIPVLRPLSGGEGDMLGNILLRDAGESVFVPTIMIRTQGTPIDERLLAAIPGGVGNPRTRDASDESGFNASDAVRALGLRGDAGAIARVLPRDNGELGFDVFLEFEGVACAPGGAPSDLVTELAGRVSVSEASLELSGLRGRLGAGPLAIDGSVGVADGALGAVDLRLDIGALDLASPFERLVAPFSSETASAIRAGIDAVALRGTLDSRVVVSADGSSGGGVGARVDISSLRSIEFNAIGDRIALSRSQGGASIDARQGGPMIAAFRDFSADASFAGEPPVRLALDGEFDASAWLSPRGSTAQREDARELRVAGEVRWPSAMTRALVRSFTPERTDTIDTALTGWGVRLLSDAHAIVRSGASQRPEVDAITLTPRSLSLTRKDHTIDLAVERGSILRRGGVILLDDLALRSEGVSLDLRGRATLGDAPSLDVDFTGSIERLDESRLAFLPGAAGDALRAATFRATRVTVDRAGLVIASSAPTLLGATIRFEGASFDVGGTDIADADGSVVLQIDTGDARPLDASLRFDSARVQRLRLGAGRARVIGADAGDSFLIPLFEADAYSGRVTGFGKITRARANAIGAPRTLEYQVEGQFSGVSLQGLRDDLAITGEQESTSTPGRSGQIDATIGVAGVAGAPSTRVGRGAVRVWGGEVVRLPLLSRLIELSNLQLPTGEELDFAHARFFLEGDRVMFEELGVASDSVTLTGQGHLRWPSLNLDLRVTSRAARRAPLLSDLFEAFRDELVTTRVTGPLTDPRYSVETLPTTRRFLDSIFGTRNDAVTRERPPARPIQPNDR